MPIFVSRFSAARSGLANFQALRTSNQASERGRTSGRQDQASAEEEDQARSTAEGSRGDTRLLVTSQRADQISQQVAGRTEAEPPSGPTTPGRRVTTVAPRAAAATQNTFAPARFTATAQTLPQAQVQTGRQGGTASLLPEARTVQIALRPVLQTTVNRLEGLTRLITSQRSGLVETNAGETVTGRVRLATSIRVEGTAATANVVRTAQAAQTATAALPATPGGEPVTTFSTASRAAEGGPTAEERLRQTTVLKQNLREDVATVTRGLLKDTIRENAQTARRIAQGILQAQRRQVRESDTSGPSALRTQLNQPSPLAQAVASNRRRSSPAIPNMSGLRSALALLGTNVNILVG